MAQITKDRKRRNLVYRLQHLLCFLCPQAQNRFLLAICVSLSEVKVMCAYQ